jgi:hypothetical protein
MSNDTNGQDVLAASPSIVVESVVKSVLHQMQKGKHTLPILILGAPGTAKTAVIRDDVISQLSAATGEQWNFNDKLRVSQIESIDVRGAMHIKDDITKYAAPEMLPNEKRDGKYGIMFIDELTDGTKSVLSSLMQILWERRIGDWTQPKHWFVVAAGNRAIDKANATGALSTSFDTRFTTLHMAISHKEWEDWAIERGGLRYEVISFLRFFPDRLHEYPNGGVPRDVSKYANLRTWEQASEILEMQLSTDAERVNLYGTIGYKMGLEFCNFLRTVRSFPADLDEIIKNPETAPVPSMDAAFALCTILAKKADPDTFDPLVTYASRLGEEYGQAMVSLATKINPDLVNTSTYTRFASEMAMAV